MHALDRNNAAINRRRIERCCDAATITLDDGRTVSGLLFADTQGRQMVVHRNGTGWRVSGVITGAAIVTGKKTRDLAMIESQRFARVIDGDL